MRNVIFALSLLALVGCCCGKCSKGKCTPETAAVDLTGKTSVTVPVNALLTAQLKVHGSVGYAATYKIADESIVKLQSSKLVYLHPENMKEGMVGGDAAKRRFTFITLKAGTTTIELISEFRGKVDKVQKVTITVTP